MHIFLKVIQFTSTYLPWVWDVFFWKIKIFVKYIFRYRHKVIAKNLYQSFGSSLPKATINTIKSDYYDVLIRYLKETFYVLTMPKSKLANSVQLNNENHWKHYFAQQKSTIIMASHYGNWEMNMVLLPLYVNQKVVAFYKPISNKKVNDFMLQSRSKYGLVLYPIEATLRVMTSLKNENVLYIFISDQSPVNMNGVFWNTFLGHQTPWLNGAEKLAVKFDYPVLYLHQIPEKNQKCYTLDFEYITENPKGVPKDTIMGKYTKILEKEVYDNPAYWLWSHKRWKRAHLFEG
jgi:Kdo2-lipid IVA lauroyltransferase/acyltransferase